MKSIEELQGKIVEDIKDNLDIIKTAKKTSAYYNNLFGRCSYILAGILEQFMDAKYDDWDKEIWFDDSLISDFNLENDNISFGGVMIWGKLNISDQWVDPFYFNIQLNDNEIGFNNYSILFADLNSPSISYENFAKNRDYFDRIEKDWKYGINVPKDLSFIQE